MTMRNCTLHTERVSPPRSLNGERWVACLGSRIEGEPHGEGPTEADAVYDLMIKLSEIEAEQEERAMRSMERE